MNKNLKPFSNNVIFLDTEFSSNNRKTAEILSIGFVKITGEELYLELKFKGKVSKWVDKHVIPFLNDKKVSKNEAAVSINKFVGNQNPYLLAYVNVYDIVYLYDLFESIDKAPFAWPPIDFASILFANGLDPKSYYLSDPNNFYKKIGIDPKSYQEHNALDDAKLLREVYLKLFS